MLRRLTVLNKTRGVNALAFAAVLVSLIPIFMTLYLIQTNGVNVPFGDEWAVSRHVVLEADDGSLSWSRLVEQQSEHRLVFTNATTALNTMFFGWNTKVEMFVSAGLVVIILLILVKLFYLEQPKAVWIIILPFSLLLFSSMQWENWLWGIETTKFYVTLFTLLAFLSIKGFPIGWKALFWAAVYAVCATFANGIGLITWALVGVALWLLGYRKWQHFAFWIVAATVCIGIFFTEYRSKPPPTGEQVTSIATLCHYWMVFLSAPFLAHLPRATALIFVLLPLVGGSFLLLDSLYIWREERRFNSVALWWMLASYAAISGLTTSWRRAQFGFDQARSSRYTSFSILFWIALIALAALAIRYIVQKAKTHWWENALLYSNLLLFVFLWALFIQSSRAAMNTVSVVSETRKQQAACMRAYPITRNPSCLDGLFSDISLLSELTSDFYRRQLGPFSEKLPDVVSLRYFMSSPLGAQVSTEYKVHLIDGTEHSVLFQHAPSMIGLAIPPPEPEQSFVLQSAIYVEPTNLIKHPQILEDGVIFRVYVLTSDGQQILAFENTFDPEVDRRPIPFEIDTSQYNGQFAGLILETSPRENANFDWSMWVEPVIQIRTR